MVLERLAVERAAAHADDKNRAALYAGLHRMEEAVASGDAEAYARHDMALHQAIWQQANSPSLLRVLDSVLGGIFVLVERDVARDEHGLIASLGQHRELVDKLAAGAEPVHYRSS